MKSIHTCGSAVLSCLCKESLSWPTSCNFPWVNASVSWVSLSVSRRRSLSSSMETINCSKCESASGCEGEPDPWPPLPPGGPSASLMVGITSHIILKWKTQTTVTKCLSHKAANLQPSVAKKMKGWRPLHSQIWQLRPEHQQAGKTYTANPKWWNTQDKGKHK